MSAVGDDVLGKEAEKQISAFGVKTERLQTVKAKKTGKCLVTLDEKGMPNYNLLNDVAYDFISYDKKIEKYGFDILAFGTLALRNENNRKPLNEIIKKQQFFGYLCRFKSQKTVLFGRNGQVCARKRNNLKI